MSDLDAWWTELTTAALVGTARRPVPAVPSSVPARAVSGEEALLDAAAVGSALRRAGRVAPTGEPPAPAPDDELAPAPRRARQLLALILDQSPVGARLQTPLLRVWLRAAADHRVRAHHGALVRLLTLATNDASLRDDVRPVLDRRGLWLATTAPSWSWAVATVPDTPAAVLDEQGWAQLPTEQRVAVLLRLRSTDPAKARELLLTTWGSDPAAARAQLLATLHAGLGPDDEELLERAMDDRAAGVREQAWALLERLPGSARARRMGERLRPLVSTTSHFLRRAVAVELPVEPGAGGARDGLVAAPKARSERGLWLERMAAGAPLEVWTDTGLDAAAVVRTLDDRDALAGLRRAVLARRDVTWARAFVDHGDDGLLVVLPDDERVARVPARLKQATTVPAVLALVAQVPAPWPPALSAAIVARLRAVARAPFATTSVVLTLAAGLHPSVAPQVEALAAAIGDDGDTDTALHRLAQFLSLVPTVTEAFR